jgi:hypothetical protein
MLRLAHNILSPDGYLFLAVSVQHPEVVTPASAPHFIAPTSLCCQFPISEFCTSEGSHGSIGICRARMQVEKGWEDGILAVSEASSVSSTYQKLPEENRTMPGQQKQLLHTAIILHIFIALVFLHPDAAQANTASWKQGQTSSYLNMSGHVPCGLAPRSASLEHVQVIHLALE